MSQTERKQEFRDITQAIIAMARDLCDEVSVIVWGGRNSLTRFGENEINQNVSGNNLVCSVTLTKDRKSSKVQTDIMDEKKLRPMLEKASVLLKYQHEDPDFPEFPDNLDADLPEGAYCEKTASLEPEQMAQEIVTHLKRCEQENLLGSGKLENSEKRIAIATSGGLFGYFEETGITFSTTVMDDQGHSGWATQTARSFETLDFETISQTAIEKSKLNVDPRDLEVGEYPVIFEPAAMTDLMMILQYRGFNTKAYLEKRSSFQDQLGQKIFNDCITIVDDPYNEIFPGMPFDFEGVARKKLTVVNQGILNELPHDLKTAKQAGKSSTGHGMPYPNSYGPCSTNLRLMPGKRTLSEIMAEKDGYLLVTHLHYTNLIDHNDLTVTGTTRDGLYWVENGKIAYPVKNMRFTESIKKVLNSIEEISSEQVFQSAFFGGGFIVPGAAISSFRFTSKTEY